MTGGVIYLDNAATTWPKRDPVYRAIDRAMREHAPNPGRGSCRTSVDPQRIVDEARQEISTFLMRPTPRASFSR